MSNNTQKDRVQFRMENIAGKHIINVITEESCTANEDGEVCLKTEPSEIDLFVVEE